MGAAGVAVQYPWDPHAWYIIRDDCPYLDLLVRGFPAQAKEGPKLEALAEAAPEGRSWQRWDLGAELARNRRFGEVILHLKVPKNCALRCYVIPTLLFTYRDVVAMIEDIESELDVSATWDLITERPDRSWSRRRNSGGYTTPTELVQLVNDELRSARSIRRDPFEELGPRSKRDVPLPENAIVSHWAMLRHRHLQQSADLVAKELRLLRERAARKNPDARQKKINDEIGRLEKLILGITELRGVISRLGNDIELLTGIDLTPVFQRDHRLRQLLRAFAPRVSEALSAVESSRSSYPPVYMNTLWELWGAVWLAKEFRSLGFTGTCFADPVDMLKSCSWQFQRGEVVLELDYEAEAALIDYERIPPVHDRGMPALEWAAVNQKFDEDRPYFGSGLRCSPDYLIRITSPAGRFLMVGDACLASPKHHGTPPDRLDTKPYTVEHYRRTIAWATTDQVVRCHPLGGFVLFPPPAAKWSYLHQLPEASDCSLLCPHPLEQNEAGARLANLISMISPEIRQL
jgi:hypothetical protein